MNRELAELVAEQERAANLAAERRRRQAEAAEDSSGDEPRQEEQQGMGGRYPVRQRANSGADRMRSTGTEKR